jgi:hypothetical protein
VRIRSLAKSVFCIALVMCAVQTGYSRTFGCFSSKSFNGILAFTNIQEESAAYTSPVSPEDLPQFGQPDASDALWFANLLTFKYSLAFEGYDPPESKQSISIIASTYVV